MTIQFNLQKSTQALSFELKKHNVQTINPCQVHVAMDTSGSFIDEHQAGYTQQLLNRLVPFSMLFDKDKVLDSISFACEAHELEQINENNYADYIQRHVPYRRGGTTNYADAFSLMVASTKGSKTQQITQSVTKAATGFFGKLFGKTTTEVVTKTVAEPSSYAEDKHLFFFVTDGSPDSESEARQVLSELMEDNIFIVFISINDRRVSFLEKFAKEPYAMYINYTPRDLRGLVNITDEDLYDQFLSASQLVTWMNK
jgi:hypothetical protein